MTALLGGAFDPVHFGHILMAEKLTDCEFVREVCFIPYRTPPHKPQPQASDVQRAEMLRLATRKYSKMSVDLREIDRCAGMNYTFDTVSEIRQELPSAAPLSLVLGMDAYRLLPTWNKFRRLPKLVHMLVFPRPESPDGGSTSGGQSVRGGVNMCADTPRIDELWEEKSEIEALTHKAYGLLCKLSHPSKDISSSGIRNALACRTPPPDHCLPNEVEQYIKKHSIYG